MDYEIIDRHPCLIGENPLWNPVDHRIYWLDIHGGAIFRYDPAAQTREVVYQGEVHGGFTFQEDGSLIVFGVAGKIARLHQGVLTTLIDRLPGEELNRFNDVIADPAGRVFCGTMPYSPQSEFGSLYCLERDGSIRKLREHIRVSNGLGFSPDLSLLYYADSLSRTVTRFRYDQATGQLSDDTIFARLAPDDGVPDGLTVDEHGYLWLAVWDGWRLIRYDPTGAIEREIRFPVKKVSSLTFGGDHALDIYITSAGGDKPEENGELAGSLFRMRLGIRGRPEFLSRIQTAT